MQTESKMVSFSNVAVGKISRLIEDNTVEVAASSAFAVWLVALWHQSAVLSVVPMPTIIVESARIIGLTSSMVTGMAAAVCIHFFVCLANPRRFSAVLRDPSYRARFTIAAWWMIAYLAVFIGLSFMILTFGGNAGAASFVSAWSLVVFALTAGLTAGAIWRVWFSIMRATGRRQEAYTTA